MALAYLGLKQDEFLSLRYGDFWTAIRLHQEEREMEMRHMGELVRGATLRLWNLQVARQHRITQPSRFWRMPWDEDSVVDALAQMSDEQRQDSIKKLLKKAKWDD